MQTTTVYRVYVLDYEGDIADYEDFPTMSLAQAFADGQSMPTQVVQYRRTA